MTARTSKEALVAQLLGELDALLYRVEALPKQFDNAKDELAHTIAALVTAGEKYRSVITQFTEDAKTELTDFIERKAATEAEKLNLTTNRATKTKPASRLEIVREHAITAATTSTVTAAIVYTIMKLH